MPKYLSFPRLSQGWPETSSCPDLKLAQRALPLKVPVNDAALEKKLTHPSALELKITLAGLQASQVQAAKTCLDLLNPE